MKRHLLSTLGYIVDTFAVQAASHFGLNRGHYAAVSFMRPDPIFALGILGMAGKFPFYGLQRSARSTGQTVL